jgi:hypothetical protein
MRDDVPAERREFTAPDGGRWAARPLERGGPSPYLAAKVARPLVEFVRLDGAAPRRYATLRDGALEGLADEELVRAWERAASC